jgi:hypothetical protein
VPALIEDRAGTALERHDSRKVTFVKEAAMYEPPALAGIGNFARVTLGRPVFGGFDSEWLCYALC